MRADLEAVRRARNPSDRRAAPCVPSSRMISQMTPLGLRPASRETSTAASVWPARTSTPPGRATSGKTWPGETIASGPLAGIDGDRDGARAVGGADSGRDALARLDRDRERGLVAAAVGAGHRLEAELVGALLGQREADQAAAVAGHEVDRVGRRHLRRDDEVALILAVFVVDEDEHAAVARLVDDRLGADQHFGVAALDQLFEPASVSAVGFQSDWPSLRSNWGEGRRRGRGRRG